MSLYEISSSLLTIRPRIRESNGVIHISNSFLFRSLCLFTYLHNVEIDFGQSLTRIQRTYFWFFKSKTIIRHKDISHLDYDYKETTTSWGWSLDGYGAQDSLDSFYVKIVTKARDEYILCTFRGESSNLTGMSGVLLGGDDIFDVSGTQADESREFVVNLCKRLKVPLGLQIDTSRSTMRCSSCHKETSAIRVLCLYCGKKLERPS